MNDLECKVVVLDLLLDVGESRAARNLGCKTEDDRQESHENREENDREKTVDETKQETGEVVDELKRRNELNDLVDVGDGTDKSNGDGPEDDEDADKTDHDDLAEDTLPPLDVEVTPDDFGRCHASETRLHVQDVVVSQTLVGGLSIIDGSEFDESRSKLLCVSLLVRGLLLSDLRLQLLQLAARPVDCVDLLTDERLQTVDGTLLGLEVAASS